LVAWLRSEGVTLPGRAESNGLSKDQINILLRRDLSTQVRRALEIRLDAAKSSIAKFDAFANRTSADGRIRDNLVYDGAARTGRWSGKGAQLQNLPRPPASMKSADIDLALKFIGAEWPLREIEMLFRAHGHGLDIITACLRPMLIAAPGHDLIAADYNAIEARGTAWLAGADRMLGIFSRGEDPYLDMASQIYQRPPENLGKTSPERQLGKTAILGLGYQMGAKRFMETCEKEVSRSPRTRPKGSNVSTATRTRKSPISGPNSNQERSKRCETRDAQCGAPRAE
jgi:DNA polymerase